MKKLIILCFMMIISSLLFSQRTVKVGNEFQLYGSFSLYSEPSTFADNIRLPYNTSVIIDSVASNNNMMVFVRVLPISDSISGYLSKYSMVMDDKDEVNKVLSGNIMNDYVKIWGQPNDRKEFKASSGYETVTLVWHCAGGRYRSIIFKQEDGIWIIDNTFTSNCIR